MKKIAFVLAAIACAAALPGPAPAADRDWLAMGKELRHRADRGDAEAMLHLGFLLSKHAPAPKRPLKKCDGKFVNPLVRTKDQKNCVLVRDTANAERVAAWQGVGTKWTAMSWIKKSAEHGNEQAMAMLCKIAKDNASPADIRADGEKWCRGAR